MRGLYGESLGRDDDYLWTWGPGRADVTDDREGAITAIPDLWGLGDAQFLNHSGSIALRAAGTLAVRFETQFIKGHRMRSRPPRGLMWALERFIAGLEPPPRAEAVNGRPDPAVSDGAAIFAERCARCHRPDRGYSGGLVSARSLGVDLAVATTTERGTGSYKVPSLRAVGRGAPYLHDGSFATLQGLLASGHPGQAAGRNTSPLLPEERDALVAFLNTL